MKYKYLPLLFGFLTMVNGTALTQANENNCSNAAPVQTKVEKETSIEITVSNPSLLVPFTALKKHQGNVSKAAKDPKLRKSRSKVRKAFKEAHEQIKQFKSLVPEIKSALKITDTIKELVNEPCYAPLFQKIAPVAQDVIALSQDLIVKTNSLIEVLDNEIKHNEALKELLGEPCQKKPLPHAKKDVIK